MEKQKKSPNSSFEEKRNLPEKSDSTEEQSKSPNSNVEKERNLPEKSDSMEKQNKSPNSNVKEERKLPQKNDCLGIKKSPVEKSNFKEKRNLRKKLLEKQRKSPNSSFEEESKPSQSNIMKEEPKALNFSETHFRQMCIRSVIMEEKSESSNIKNFSESDEKSSIPSHDVPEQITIEQGSSNREDFVSQPSQSDITEEQPESTRKKQRVEKNNESDKKSSPSIPSHDVPKTFIKQAPSNQEDFVSQPSQSDITEEQSESTNVEKNNESDEKLSSPFIPSHDVPGTSVEQDSSNRENYFSQPSQSDITEEQSESTNVEKNNESDEKLSSPFIPSHDVPGTSVEQDSSNRENYFSQPSQSDIMEGQESTNVEKNNESDEKSSSPSIPSHDVPGISAEQDSSNRENYFSQPSQSNITKKQSDFINITKNKSHEISPSPSKPSVNVPRIKTLSNLMEDYISQPPQSDITEERSESTNVKKDNESDKKSSSPSIPSPRMSVETLSNFIENYISQPLQSDIMEEQSESTNVEKNNESDEKSSSPSIPSHDVREAPNEQASSNQEDFVSQPSQSDITEEQLEPTNVEKDNESDKKSASPSIPSHDVREVPNEQTSSNQEDFVSQPSQSDITEEQLEPTNVEKDNESDKKSASPSIPSHDVREVPNEQTSSNQEDFVSKPSQSNITEKQSDSINIEENDGEWVSKIPRQPPQSDITEERSESTNVKKDNESDKKSSSPSIPSPRMSVETLSNFIENYISQPLQSDIMEEQSESTNVEKNNESDEKSSSPSIPSHDVREAPNEQASSNQEDFVSHPSQSDITEEQLEPTNVEKDNESDKKSASPSIPSHDVREAPNEQASSNQEDFVSQPSQSDITEEQLEPTNVEKDNESDKKSASPSIPSHDVREVPNEQTSSNQEDFVSQPSQSDITEEQLESTNVEKDNESDKKSSSPSIPSHDVREVPNEQTSSNQEDFVSKPSQSNITEKQSDSINIEENDGEWVSKIPREAVYHYANVKEPKSSNIENFSDEKSSSPSTLKHDVPETYIEKTSNSEVYDSQPSQSDITKEQLESTNVEKNNESDEKSSSPSIPNHDVPGTSVEQALLNQEDYVRERKTNIEENESNEKSSSSSVPTNEFSPSAPFTDYAKRTTVMENIAPYDKMNSPKLSTELSLTKLSSTVPFLTESPKKPSPTESSPMEPSLMELSPTKSSSTEPFTEPSSSQSSSTELISSAKSSPIKLSPTEPSPMKSSPTTLSSTEPSSTKLSPTEPSPTEPSPTEPSPTEPSPTEPSPTEPSPTEPSPTEPFPTESSPMTSSSAEPSSTKLPPSEPSPTEPSPKESSSTEPSPTEPSPTEPSPAESSPTESSPTKSSPMEPSLTEPSPTEPFPMQPFPTEPSPTEPSLTKSSPTEPSPTESSPTELSPTELSPTEPLHMKSFDSDSNATVIERPTTSKSALELKPLFLQRYIQENESDTKSTDDQYKKEEKHRSIIEKSPTELSLMESSSTRPSPTESSEDGQVGNMQAEKSKDLTENIPDNISKSPAPEPADNQAETTSDNEFENAVDPTTSITENSNQPLQTTSDVVEDTSPESRTADKIEKDDEPEDDPQSNSKIRKGSKCCLVLLIISLILCLSLSLFLLYHFGFLNFYQNKHTDILQTAVVELEKIIYDEDDTVRDLNKYLDQDTSLIKVVALIGDSIIDKSYTVDIIRKKLRRKRRNGPSLWFPDFVIMENLRKEHSITVVDYAETFQEAYNDRPFTILAVYKIEEMNDNLKRRLELNQTIEGVKDTFIKADINFKIIFYKLLTDTILDQHIINMEKKLGQTFSPDQIYNIKQRLIEDRSHCQEKYDCNKDH